MKGGTVKRSEHWAAAVFVAPVVLIILVFLTVPIIKALTMSFQYWYMSKPSPKGNYFVAFDNYTAVFKDRYFLNSVRTTIIYILVTVILRYFLGFGAALLLNQQFRGRGIARSLLIIPWAIPEVVACLIWILMYDRDYGIINHLLRNIGLLKVNIGYLQDPAVALPAAMAVNIWKGFPFVAIMLLAGFQSISKELYEAASIDGANAWQKLQRITIPGVKPISKVVFLLLVIWTVKDYAIAFCLAHGGPSRATEILTIYVQQTAFKYFDFGRASAAGVIMLIVSIIFTFFYFEIADRGKNEG
jgi:multiple sugar transport system permease protein